MNEEQLGEAILDLARLYGWLAFHPRPARTAKGWRTLTQGDTGFPDWVLVRPPRVIFLELKSDKGAIRPMQAVWADALNDCPGVMYALIRPSDIDRLAEMLR